MENKSTNRSWNQHANALIGQSNGIRKSECCVMDKVYDSEKIHYLIREEIRADSITPLKGKKENENSGAIQKTVTLAFDNLRYY